MLENNDTPEIICLESIAFYKLVDKVIAHVQKNLEPQLDPWITDDEAMKELKITSPTTLKKYRDEGRIRFTQPSRKVILYHRQSILDYLEKHAKNTF